MSATIHILPVIRIARDSGDETQDPIRIPVRVSHYHWKRLVTLAREWGCTEEMAAEMMLAEILNGRR